MAVTVLARRYAKSLLSLAGERGLTDAVDADMRQVYLVVGENRELGVALSSAVIRPEKKEAVIRNVFASLNELTVSFLAQLALKGRAGVLSSVAEAVMEQVRFERNIVLAEAVTSTPLDAERRSEIMTLIGRIHQGGVELTEKVDPTLIGGFSLRVGDRMIDASVRSTLRSMHRDLTNNPYEPAY